MDKISKYIMAAIALTMLLVGPTAVAHEGAHKANPGYVGDMNGHIELDGAGNCIRTSIFNKDKHGVVECGDAVEKKVAKPAPAPAPKPAPAPPVVLKDVTLGAHALFDTNKAVIRADGRAELDALVASLNEVKRVDSISIIGHTDSTGTAQYNQGLSERRANAVSSYLASKGVNSSIINATGNGESAPVADNKTRAGRQQNRRVNIVITGVK